MDSLRRFFEGTPEAAVGEIGLDKGSYGKSINFGEQVLKYVASLLEMPETELSELSYMNATKLFSYPGSKVNPQAETV